MTSGRRMILANVAACALLATTAAAARAQIVAEGPCIGACKSEIVGILVGLGVGGAAIGAGVYYAVHHNHSLDGCAVSGPSGLELLNRGDRKTYSLLVATAGIEPGHRIRVSGKKEKKDSGAPQDFLVEKLKKDYGPCAAEPESK